MYPNEIVTIQSSTLSIKLPNVYATFYLQELHRNSLHFTSHKNTITSRKSRQFTPHHYTSHHFTYLHSIPTWILLLVTTCLTLFLNVFILQGKDASKLAGNWHQPFSTPTQGSRCNWQKNFVIAFLGI